MKPNHKRNHQTAVASPNGYHNNHHQHRHEKKVLPPPPLPPVGVKTNGEKVTIIMAENEFGRALSVFCPYSCTTRVFPARLTAASQKVQIVWANERFWLVVDDKPILDGSTEKLPPGITVNYSNDSRKSRLYEMLAYEPRTPQTWAAIADQR